MIDAIDSVILKISGVLYQVASDKVGELASGLTEKATDKMRKIK